MSRNKVLMIFGAILLLLFIIFSLLTEYREVSSNEWRESFDFDDKQPQGLYIFKELVERYYEGVPMTLNGYPEDTTNTKSLYIQFVPDYLEDDQLDTLKSIANHGNDVLIIADYFSVFIADSTAHQLETTFITDSILRFNFTDNEFKADSSYVYQFHDYNFDTSRSFEIPLITSYDWENDEDYMRVLTSDSLALMVSIPMGSGDIYYHVKKDFFYNYSYRQNQMFDYTASILSHFDPHHIYLLSPIQLYASADQLKRNPLDYIMSQPPLKAAYYLLLLGALLYVLFGGKRKQKIIPVIQQNKNTSLEYIDTVSQLFYQQEQPDKLVKHMKNIFYYKVQKKFFIPPDHSDFVKVLSKKSKIPEVTLQYVMDRFKNAENPRTFRKDQLVSLNRKLETIYEEMENA